MSKLRFSAVSLVAALPAAFLAYLMVMAFLGAPGFDMLPTLMKVVTVLTLLCAVTAALMPIGILLFMHQGTAKAGAEGTMADDGDGGALRSAVATGAAVGAVGGAAALADDEMSEFVEDDEEGFGSSAVAAADDYDEFGDDEFDEEGFGSSVVVESGVDELDEDFGDDGGGSSVVVDDEFDDFADEFGGGEFDDSADEGDLFNSDDGFDAFDLGDPEEEK